MQLTQNNQNNGQVVFINQGNGQMDNNIMQDQRGAQPQHNNMNLKRSYNQEQNLKNYIPESKSQIQMNLKKSIEFKPISNMNGSIVQQDPFIKTQQNIYPQQPVQLQQNKEIYQQNAFNFQNQQNQMRQSLNAQNQIDPLRQSMNNPYNNLKQSINNPQQALYQNPSQAQFIRHDQKYIQNTQQQQQINMMSSISFNNQQLNQSYIQNQQYPQQQYQQQQQQYPQQQQQQYPQQQFQQQQQQPQFQQQQQPQFQQQQQPQFQQQQQQNLQQQQQKFQPQYQQQINAQQYQPQQQQNQQINPYLTQQFQQKPKQQFQQKQQLPQQGQQLQSQMMQQQQFKQQQLPTQSQFKSQQQNNKQDEIRIQEQKESSGEEGQLVPILNCILEKNDSMGGLYLGDYRAASDDQVLANFNIGAVLSLMKEFNREFPKSVDNLLIKMWDMESQDILQFFQQALSYIEQNRKQGKNVLVHCYAGRSRSATIVIAYMMTSKQMTYQQAFDYVKDIRPIIDPNLGFQQQLQQYDKKLQQYKANNGFMGCF